MAMTQIVAPPDSNAARWPIESAPRANPEAITNPQLAARSANSEWSSSYGALISRDPTHTTVVRIPSTSVLPRAKSAGTALLLSKTRPRVLVTPVGDDARPETKRRNDLSNRSGPDRGDLGLSLSTQLRVDRLAGLTPERSFAGSDTASVQVTPAAASCLNF